MKRSLVVALCRRTAPLCPACGGLLGVLVEAGHRVSGRCPRNRCRQHYSVVGNDRASVLVVALTPAEYQAALRDQPLEIEHAVVAYSQPEPAA